MTELRFRQIHLDFHTSEHIQGVGAGFDPEKFAGTLEKARVNSITCFARGHHGWLYYDSKKFPERVHPYLENKNLLKEQIEACHARNIRVPIYITVQWDYYTSQRHPDWCVLTPEGSMLADEPFQPGFYRFLCVNSPYREFLKENIAEVMEMLPTDGIFLDIVQVKDCACFHCQTDMLARGMDPGQQAERLIFAKQMLNDFKAEISALIRAKNPDCTIFFNAGHIGPELRECADAYSHWELESLPSGGWGYLHFPLTVRYARTLGHDCLGMTGKFHTSWGDFHSFKNQAALEYECFNMLAQNAKCSIGDQLPPNGKICPHVYDLVGAVYSQVEKKEPWCRGAWAVTDIALLNPSEWNEDDHVPTAAAGAVQILQEAGHQFDIIDSVQDFSPYKLLILPDVIPVDDTLAAALSAYVHGGGKVIASFESGMDLEKKAFNWPELGVRLRPEQTRDEHGELVRGRTIGSDCYLDYLMPAGEIGKNMRPTEHVMYLKGVEVDAVVPEHILIWNKAPYFNRTWDHFCSHRQAPCSGEKTFPAVVGNENVIYFCHPIFTQYRQRAPRWCKQLVVNAIEKLVPEPILKHDGPSTLQTTVNEQSAENRRIVHLLHYIPERRAEQFDIIEDVIPLYNVSLQLRTCRKVATVRSVPEDTLIEFSEKGKYVAFTIPEIRGHQMIEITFDE